MDKFIDGQRVSMIAFPDEGFYRIGDNKCESITVCMENGEMAPVAWFLVIFTHDRAPIKINGKYIESVELLS